MRTSGQLDVLMPHTRQRILATLLLNPERRWYLRELAREIQLPPSSLQQELRQLSDAEIIKRFTDENRLFYQANRTLPYFAQLQFMLKSTIAVDIVLCAALKPDYDKIDISFVFGSFASSSEVNSSDIDLAIISDKHLLELPSRLREAEDELHRDINIVQYSPTDLRVAWMARRNFVRTIVASPKLYIIGDDDVLTATLGGSPDQDASAFASGDQRVA